MGVGIFLTPAGMARGLGSPGLVFLVWAFMGAAALCGALSLGELAARYPEAGGSYVYLREAYGPAAAFLYGWKCLLVMDPGLTAALAMGLGAYAQATVPGLSPKAVALGAILVIAAANVLGVRFAGAIGHALALAKIVLLLGLVAWGFASGAGDLAPLRAVLRPASRRRARSCRRWRAPSCSRSSRSAAGGRRPSSRARCATRAGCCRGRSRSAWAP